MSDAEFRDLAPGDKIANEYQIVRLVGEGAFGAVYLCRSAQGEVAVKVLRRVDNADDRQRLKEEARRWAELGLHTNVVFAVGVKEHARAPCIVMEYVEGARTLGDMIAAGGGDWRLALWVGAQAASGLDHAWKTKRLLHRDIKPANILVRPDLIAKVGDFGLATANRLESDQLKGARIGTPLYMAPEIWDGSASGTAADIYALGVTLYEAACGQWPYAGDAPRSLADVAHCHRQGYPAHVRGLAPDMPAAFADLIMSCLAKNPDRRAKSFDALAAKLNALARDEIGQDARRLPPTRQLDEAERLTNLVNVHLALGDFGKARGFAEQAVRLAPGNAKVWTGLAAVQGGQGQRREAAQSLLKGLAQNPDAETAFLIVRDLAQCYFLLDDKDEARHWLERAIDHAERHDRFALLDGRSNLIVDLLPYDRAMMLCDRILQSDANAAFTWNNRAVGCRRHGDFAEAERSARRAVELNPLYAKAWTNLANALIQQDRFSEGIDAARRSIDIDPKVGGAYLALHAAYTMMDRDSDAWRAINEGARQLPDHPQIRQVLAHMRSRK